jgi:hypothetical protein
MGRSESSRTRKVELGSTCPEMVPEGADGSSDGGVCDEGERKVTFLKT